MRALKNPLVRNISAAAAVAFFGFILLNITFLLDFVYQSAIRGIVSLFVEFGPDTAIYWLPPLMHMSFTGLIGMISWFVLRSGMKVIYKAIYITVPSAVALVTIGMFLYRWKIASYAAGALFCIIALYYLHRTKQPWLYCYSVALVGLTLAIFTLFGGEI